MEKIRKNVILICLLMICLIIVLIILFFGRETIKLIEERIKEQLSASTKSTVVDYEIMNLDGENIEILFITENENGIEKIVLPDIELNGKEKTKIAFDRTLKEGEVYQLKTQSEENNKEELHTFLATTKPKISVSNRDVLGDGTTETAKIEYPENDNITKYYSLDNGGTWQVYTGEINVPKGETENILARIEWNEGKTINKPIRYTEMIYVTYNEESSSRTIEIKYNENYIQGTSKYYKIGETREWQEYTGEITLNDSDIDLNDIKKGTNKLAIYAKQMIDDRTVSISEYEEEITTTVKLDVFNDIKLSGKTLNEYGFTASWSGIEWSSFTIGQFLAGRGAGEGNWSGKFNWNNAKTYGATSLYVDFYQRANGNGRGKGSTATTQINILYNDGTTTNKSNETLKGTIYNSPPYVHYPLEMELTSDDINYIQFYMYRL